MSRPESEDAEALRPDQDAAFWLSGLLFPGLWRRRVIAGAILAALGGYALLSAPFSPLAMGLADARFATGDAVGAIRGWQALAQFSPLRSSRARATFKSAKTAMLVLDDAPLALASAEPLAEAHAGTPLGLEAEQLVAELWAARPAQAVAAAERFEALARESPNLDVRVGLMISAAKLRSQTHDLQAALNAWDAVADIDPRQAGRVGLQQGALLLAADDLVGALEAYEQAVQHADQALQTAAQLGISTTKARLGDVEGALAGLEAAGLPEDVAKSRAAALQKRAQPEAKK